MSSVLLNKDGTSICPACIEYSGAYMEHIRAGNNEKNDGSGHISMSYRIYRWFGGVSESSTEFQRLYSNWSNRKHSKDFFIGESPANFEQRCKSLCNEYNKKIQKNPSYGSKGCREYVYNSNGCSNLCYMCPLSPEYTNGRIEYENTVLGYSLVNLDTSFVDIIWGGILDAEYIYYENIASHFTGMSVLMKENTDFRTYNFNALVAYYIIRNANNVKKGDISPALKELQEKMTISAGAAFNVFLEEMLKTAETLKPDGGGYCRNTSKDYSFELTHDEATQSFKDAIRNIISSGLTATKEEYLEAAANLKNVYSYDNGYAANRSFSKANRYITSLGVQDNIELAPSKKSRSKSRKRKEEFTEKATHSKKSNVSQYAGQMDIFGGLAEDSYSFFTHVNKSPSDDNKEKTEQPANENDNTADTSQPEIREAAPDEQAAKTDNVSPSEIPAQTVPAYDDIPNSAESVTAEEKEKEEVRENIQEEPEIENSDNIEDNEISVEEVNSEIADNNVTQPELEDASYEILTVEEVNELPEPDTDTSDVTVASESSVTTESNETEKSVDDITEELFGTPVDKSAEILTESSSTAPADTDPDDMNMTDEEFASLVESYNDEPEPEDTYDEDYANSLLETMREQLFNDSKGETAPEENPVDDNGNDSGATIESENATTEVHQAVQDQDTHTHEDSESVHQIAEPEQQNTSLEDNGFCLTSGYVSDKPEQQPERTETTSELSGEPAHNKTDNESAETRTSPYELSHMSVSDESFGDFQKSYGLSEREALDQTAKCQYELTGTEPIAIEYAFNSELDTYGILVYTGSNDRFWYIIEQSDLFENTMYWLFKGERVKICVNYPAVQSYLIRHGFKQSNNLVSLPAMYAATHPDTTRIIVEDIFNDMAHTAQNPLRQYMLNYKGCYYGLKRTLDASEEYSDKYNEYRYMEDIMAASYDLSDISTDNQPGITTMNYSSLNFNFNADKLTSNNGYCLITASIDKDCLYGVNSEKILMDVIIRMCKGHLFTRFGMKVLNAKDYSIVIACPVSVYASANDILIDIIKKACRQADREKKIVPKIILDNKLM